MQHETSLHPQSSKFEDTETVDWVQDTLFERSRRLTAVASSYSSSGSNSTSTFKERFYTLFQNIESWIVVFLVGVAIGCNAAIIAIVTQWLSDFRLGYCSTNWWLNRKFCCWEIEADRSCPEWISWSQWTVLHWLLYMVFAAILAFSSSLLVRVYAPLAAGSGIGEIKCILSGFVVKGFLSLPVLIIKSVALPLTIASGISVGKEGPSVHVASCTGSVVANAFKHFRESHRKMREIVTAASAAGVAVAFGSPIGGVLFSLEEMSIKYTIKTMWKSFFCALVATVTLSAFNPFRTGKLVLFQVSYDRDWHFFELGFFMLIGVFGALYGAFVIKCHLKVQAFRRKHLSQYPIEEAIVIAVLTSFIGYYNMFLRMDMTESLEVLFRECTGGGDYEKLCQSSTRWQMINSLFLATVLRTCFVIISYGCKVPAGIFVPSMAVGATFGRMVGIFVKTMHIANPSWSVFAACDPEKPCITPGAYALIGASATLAGVTRVTVTVVTIAFELTGQGAYILPIMIVVMITKSVGDLFGKGGIADRMNQFNGYPILEAEDDFLNVPVSEAMTRDLVTLPLQGMKGDELEARLRVTSYRIFPVVSDLNERKLVGYVTRPDVLAGLNDAEIKFDCDDTYDCIFGRSELSEEESYNENKKMDFSKYVQKTTLTVSPGHSLGFVMDVFRNMGPRILLVVRHGTLIGLVTVKDILKHQLESEVKSHAEGCDNDSDVGLWTAAMKGVLEKAENFISDSVLWLTDKYERIKGSRNRDWYSHLNNGIVMDETDVLSCHDGDDSVVLHELEDHDH